MASVIQEIFQRHFARYLEHRKLPLFQLRAGHLISVCRTSALGGHVQGCPNGHVRRIQYNGCRHRLCEQCAGMSRARWLQAERARVVPSAHRHIVFTIPHALNGLWSHNRERMANVLFAAAADTLKGLLEDERYLGAQAGMTLALHTWGRGLWLHPHVHALVSEGGWDGQGWVQPRRGHFLPARVTMMVFRGKLLAYLYEGLLSGEWVMPADSTVQRMVNVLNKLGRQRWNVRIGERYAHGEGVVKYLGRYVRGGPLKSTQLGAPSTQGVSFRYRPHTRSGASAGVQEMRLSVVDFFDRYLTHTPVPRQHQVRRYGLYSASGASALSQARSALETRAPSEAQDVASNKPVRLSWQAYVRGLGHASNSDRCEVCAAPIVFLGRLGHPRGPP